MFSTCGATSPEPQEIATMQFFYVEPVKYSCVAIATLYGLVSFKYLSTYFLQMVTNLALVNGSKALGHLDMYVASYLCSGIQHY